MKDFFIAHKTYCAFPSVFQIANTFKWHHLVIYLKNKSQISFRAVSMLTLFPLLFAINAQAQEIGFNLNYQFVKANEWNRATQVYNFSRPFLANKQPLLKHGLSFGFYYLRKPENSFSIGPSVQFSFHRSAAENPNFDIGIRSLLLDLGAKMQYRPSLGESDNWRMSITPSLTAVTLARKLNGETVIIGETEEDQKLRTFGVGFGLNAQITYDYVVSDNWIISPMIGIDYKPYLWAERGEIIFNESATGDLKSNTSILGLQGGVVFRRKKN